MAGALGCYGRSRCYDGLYIGLALGISTLFIDSVALAWTKEKPETKVGRVERAGLDFRLYAAPTPSRDGMIAGVSGTM